jgi:hypothetical protein
VYRCCSFFVAKVKTLTTKKEQQRYTCPPNTRELHPPDPRTPAEGREGGKAEVRSFSF